MALSNYERAYELTVGKPAQYKTSLIPASLPDVIASPNVFPTEGNFSPAADIEFNTRTAEANARTLTTQDNKQALQIKADIKGSNKSQGNDPVGATIEVCNASEQTQNVITQKGSSVILKAGYIAEQDNNSLPIVFTGQVESSFVEKRGQDIVTVLRCVDGYASKDGIRVSINMSPFVFNRLSYVDVINEIANIFRDNGISSDSSTLVLNPVNIDNNSVILDPQFVNSDTPIDEAFSFLRDPRENVNTELPNGFTASGYLRDILEDVCKSIGFVWTILDNVLYVHPLDYKSFVLPVALPEGLIKSIRPQQDNARESSTKDTKAGIAVRTFLNGRFKFAKRVNIPTGRYAGDYIITEFKHTLDYRGNPWDTNLLLERIE